MLKSAASCFLVPFSFEAKCSSPLLTHTHRCLLRQVSACDQYLKPCSSASALASNFKMTTSPEYATLSPGDEFTTNFEYDLSKEVTGGKAHYSASISGIPVINTDNDLCSDLKDGNNPCPLLKGFTSYSSVTTVPTDLPAGTLHAKTTWYDSNGDEVLAMCSQLCT